MIQQRGHSERVPMSDIGLSSISGPDRLNDEQRAELARLRSKQSLTAYEQGQLRALSRFGGAADRQAQRERDRVSRQHTGPVTRGDVQRMIREATGQGDQGDDQPVTRDEIREVIQQGLGQGGTQQGGQGDQGDDAPVTRGDLEQIIKREITLALRDLADVE